MEQIEDLSKDMEKKMKVSVAMTTYNGSKYILEQLKSIYSQTRKPDEVIISDDSSSDDTVKIVENFCKEYNLSNWVLSRNQSSLGWRQNFRKSISMTTGDIIFFSDQDDIWMQDKIEKMTSIMEKEKAGCLFGKCKHIDSDGNLLKQRDENISYTGRLTKVPLRKSFYSVGGLGCCMCVSRAIANKYLQLNCIFDDHDSQCPRIAVLYDALYVVDVPVIYYRMHTSNTSGVSITKSYGSSSLKERISEIERIVKWLLVVKSDEEIITDSKKKTYVIEALKVEKERWKYLNDSKIGFFHILKYCKYYPNITMLIGDFAYKHRINDALGQIRWKLRSIIHW